MFSGALSLTEAQADTSLTATGSASTGYSTNILGVPATEDPAAAQVPEADGFSDLTPGLSAAYEHRRGVHNLNYVFGARLFLRNSEANSYNNTLSYQNILSTSARGSLRMGASFNSGRVNAFDQAGADFVGEGDLLPDGDVEFIAYNANVSYRHQLSQVWTGEAAVSGGKFVPTSGVEQSGETTNADLNLRLDRSFQRHRVGMSVRTAFNRQEVPDVQRTLTFGPGVFWTWNTTDAISLNASGGLDVIGEYPGLGRGLSVPRASAAVTYSHERGRATMGATRGVAANLFGGDTTVNTQYFSNVAMPLPSKRPMVVGLAAAYATGDIIDITLEDPRGTTERVSADINLGMELTRAWQLGVRLETSKQTQRDVLADMSTFEATTTQTQGLIVLTGRFPEVMAAQVPVRSTDRVESGDSDFSGGATGPGNGGAAATGGSQQ